MREKYKFEKAKWNESKEDENRQKMKNKAKEYANNSVSDFMLNMYSPIDLSHYYLYILFSSKNHSSQNILFLDISLPFILIFFSFYTFFYSFHGLT